MPPSAYSKTMAYLFSESIMDDFVNVTSITLYSESQILTLTHTKESSYVEMVVDLAMDLQLEYFNYVIK